MDAFEVHRQLIADYQAFTEGFISAREERVSEAISEQAARGLQWPDPWLSLNPSCASGGRISELVSEGLLVPECERIFRSKQNPMDPGTHDLPLHRHQREAIKAASEHASYVLTTVTDRAPRAGLLRPDVSGHLCRCAV